MDLVLSQLALVASLVERAVQFVKPVYQDRFAEYQKQIDIGLSVAFNVGLCYAWQVDLFAASGFAFNPVAGSVLTGAVASLGSGVVHELIQILESFRKGLPAPKA